MIIDLTCYPTGDGEPLRGEDDSSAALCHILTSYAPPGWPTVKLLSVEMGHTRGADFPSAVLLFVFTAGGATMPAMPKVADLTSERIVWRNFILTWDYTCARMRIEDIGNWGVAVS